MAAIWSAKWQQQVVCGTNWECPGEYINAAAASMVVTFNPDGSFTGSVGNGNLATVIPAECVSQLPVPCGQLGTVRPGAACELEMAGECLCETPPTGMASRGTWSVKDGELTLTWAGRPPSQFSYCVQGEWLVQDLGGQLMEIYRRVH